jgi:hypothetical protein
MQYSLLSHAQDVELHRVVSKIGVGIFGGVQDVPILERAGFQFQQVALQRLRAGELRDLNVDERVFFLERVGHRLETDGIERAQNTEPAFLLGFGENLIAAGFERQTLRLGLLFGFDHRRAWSGGAKRC